MSSFFMVANILIKKLEKKTNHLSIILCVCVCVSEQFFEFERSILSSINWLMDMSLNQQQQICKNKKNQTLFIFYLIKSFSSSGWFVSMANKTYKYRLQIASESFFFSIFIQSTFCEKKNLFPFFFNNKKKQSQILIQQQLDQSQQKQQKRRNKLCFDRSSTQSFISQSVIIIVIVVLVQYRKIIKNGMQKRKVYQKFEVKLQKKGRVFLVFFY